MPELGIAAREHRLHLRHRLLEPLPVLHEHLRLSLHPRPRAGDRHRPEGDAAELSVWVVTGDGDALSASAATTCIHVLRRNVDVNILLFNNRIYGLTKGQYSPTSELGKVTKSTPLGSVDYPFNPISVALGAEAPSSRAPSTSRPSTCRRSSGAPASTAARRSSRSCRTATSSTTAPVADSPRRTPRPTAQLVLEHGKPLVFGKNRDKGIRMRGHTLEVVQLGDGISEARPPRARRAGRRARLPAQQHGAAEVSRPRSASSAPSSARPTRGDRRRRSARRRAQGDGDLDELLQRGDTWVVE